MAAHNHLQFCLARAAQSRAEAEAATLDHVRERCRRSEAAWTELAERAASTKQMRDDRIAHDEQQALIESAE